jgi:MarR family transcriptional regulator, organic hydroperoxide resistance regulator
MKRPQQAVRAQAEPPAPAPEDEYLKLENQLCFPLYAASRLMVGAYRPLLADLGLTYPQYLVLLVLWEKDGLSVGAIGELLLLDSGTLTPVLKRLQAQGLIVRSRTAGDDRVVENWLSAKGKAMKKDAVRVPIELICRSGIGMDELERLRSMLHDLIGSLQKIQSAAPADE